MKRGLITNLLAGVVAVSWAAPAPAQTVPAASTREAPLTDAQRDALQGIIASAARHDSDSGSSGADADTARLLKAQTAAIRALAAQIKRLEARVALLERQR